MQRACVGVGRHARACEEGGGTTGPTYRCTVASVTCALSSSSSTPSAARTAAMAASSSLEYAGSCVHTQGYRSIPRASSRAARLGVPRVGTCAAAARARPARTSSSWTTLARPCRSSSHHFATATWTGTWPDSVGQMKLLSDGCRTNVAATASCRGGAGGDGGGWPRAYATTRAPGLPLPRLWLLRSCACVNVRVSMCVGEISASVARAGRRGCRGGCDGDGRDDGGVAPSSARATGPRSAPASTGL
jgi:hypothetical protein